MSADSSYDHTSPPASPSASAPSAARRGPSRLPVPKKASALPVPASRSAQRPDQKHLRKQPSTETFKPTLSFGVPDPTSKGLPRFANQPGREIDAGSGSSSSSRAGGYLAGTSSSAAKGIHKGPSGFGVNAATGTPLKKKPSVSALQQPTPPVSPRLANKSSSSSLRQPLSPLTPRLTKSPSIPSLKQPSSPGTVRKSWGTSDANGTTAPPLSRRASNSALNQSTARKPLNRKASASSLSPTSDAPKPLRRMPSSELPRSPKTPTAAQAPRKASLTDNKSRTASRPPKAQPIAPVSPEKPKNEYRAASQSLRDTIAKAKAAKKASLPKNELPAPPVSPGQALNSFDFGTADPFNQSILGVGGSSKVLMQRIKSARFEGRLNICALDLKEIPASVYKMYETNEEDLNESSNDDGPKWYESVDLTRFLAADNEIEAIGDEMVTEFGGLTQIDMHNNLLTALPTNFGTLTELTVLNLSNNQLNNKVMDVICQITSLKDLKLAKNGLEGMLTANVSKLVNLENLDLQGNRLKSLPGSLSQLSHLRTLNVSDNALSFVPFGSLCRSPLNELDVSNNNLSGTLFPEIVKRMESLRSLDIRNNHLEALTEAECLVMPNLHQLLASNNRLVELPPLDEWKELLVLLVDQNSLQAIPDGLLELPKLRTFDFSANNVKVVDPRLGAMESLEIIKFDGNPIRDRNLMSMSSSDIKKTLRARLAPTIIVADADEEDGSVPVSPDGFIGSAGGLQPRGLDVGRSGVLDLSCKDYNAVTPELLATVSGSPSTLLLSKNNLTVFPTGIEAFSATLTTLDLSHNRFLPAYLETSVSLRALSTLTLVNTSLTSLEPLLNLDAPKLDVLDVSANRIVSIEGIKQHFPSLTALLGADNAVKEILVESVRGLRTLDLSGNSIERLPYELGACEGLRELRVQGNLFRVPRYQILEKGSEAVLEWLREKLPQEGQVVADTSVDDID